LESMNERLFELHGSVTVAERLLTKGKENA
jgi:hypothetical protein